LRTGTGTEREFFKEREFFAFLKPLILKKKKPLQAENLLATDFILKWKLVVAKLRKIDSIHSKKLLKHVEHREKEIFDNPVMRAVKYLDKRTNAMMTCESKASAKQIIRMVVKKKEKLENQEEDEEVTNQSYADAELDDEFSSLNDILIAAESESEQETNMNTSRMQLKRP
jgi:predicted RND superfamily exporter protein